MTKTQWVPLRALILKELGKTRKALTCHDLYALPQIKACAAHHSDVARALSQVYRAGKNGVDRVQCGPNQPNCQFAYFSTAAGHDAALDQIPHLDHEPVYEKPTQAALPLAPKKPAIRIKGQPEALDIRHKDNGSIEIETPSFAILIEA